MSSTEKKSSSSTTPLNTIVSGGQTGVDRAALDAAIAVGIKSAGWCPQGRRSEDGQIPACYQLKETASRNYTVRTEWNIRDSDGTLIIAMRTLTGGTRLTWRLAKKLQKPCHVVHLRESADAELFSDQNPPTDHCSAVVEWIRENRICVLNVAGPRASSHPEIHAEAQQLITEVLQRLMDTQNQNS